MRLLRPLSRPATTVAGLILLLAACGKLDPSGPVIEAQQLALEGDIAVRATVDVPPSRAPDAALNVHVTLTNRTRHAREVAVGSSSCTIFVRLLAAAPGAGASATFYDDFQRACTRDLKYVTLPAGGAQTLHHAVPLSAIAEGAPDALQAHIGLRLDRESVLLHVGPFHLP